MKPNAKISAAVAAILSAPSTVIVFAQTAPATGELAEVVVTATRRTENLQDVPITVQAVSGEQLRQLSLTTFDDLIKYTPNVTSSGNGPGTGNIFIRGLGGVGTGNQSQSTTAPFPNVALYLDDQAMQFPARNNDAYLVDMERVEVLEGPQGTLFGGGAQAGAIRYITNKPKLDAVSGDVHAGYGITAGGDPNSIVNATVNLPIVNDTFGVRAVIFSEHRGGYISNVPGTISFNLPSNYLTTTGQCTPPSHTAGCGSPFVRLISPVGTNPYLLGEDTNGTTVQGFRLSALWKISDTWDFLLQQNYQDLHSTGYYYAYPLDPNGAALANNQLTAFTPAYNKDKYESTAWTVTGQIGDVKAVYTGSYLVRNIDGQQDYSNYLRSGAGSYYGCIGPGAGYFNTKLDSKGNPKYKGALVGTQLTCYAPVGSWRDIVNNTHQSHELRLSTNENYRVRALVGGYWEKFVINDSMNFNYLSIPQCGAAGSAILTAALAKTGPACLSAVGPLPGTWATNPSLRTNMNNAFGEDDQRGYKQTAEFASVDFDIVPKTLILTGGIRHYDYKEFEHGSEWYSESSSPLIINHPNGACVGAGACGFPINLDKSESGNRYRGDLTWHITQDVMAYYTYSDGFRPGGFNRTQSTVAGVVTLKHEAPFSAGGSDYQYLKPAGYDSDTLVNNEIGLKSEFAQHRVLMNATVYDMKWKGIQLALFDPVHLGNTTFVVNGPTYEVKGAELQMVARITEGFSLQGSGAWNRSEQTDAPCLSSAGVTPATPTNPTPAGQCVTQVKGKPYTNPFGQLGTRPPWSPAYMWNLRARYEWNSGNIHPFIWAGANTIGSYTNEPASFPDGNSPAENPPTTTEDLYKIPGYTTYDAALGVSKEKWTVQLTGSNITNVQTPTNISSGQFIKSEIPIRPRVLMFQATFAY